MTDDEKLRRALADEPEFCGEVRHLLRAEVLRLRAIIQGETALASGDGTDRLLAALYGESSERTIGKAIGGSNARMLGDAAREIERLREIVRDECCLCRFGPDPQTGNKVLVQECHWHQCERSVRLPNGDPSDVTLEDELARLRLLLTRKTEALAVFACPQMWYMTEPGAPGVTVWEWNGVAEYRNPMKFAAKERDADEPTD